jgi:tetratricopeptide (TPR) repeat protein
VIVIVGVFAMEFYMRGRHRFSKGNTSHSLLCNGYTNNIKYPRIGDVEGAVEDFSKAIQLAEKRKIKAHYLELRAFAYAELGKHDLARDDVDLATSYVCYFVMHLSFVPSCLLD